MKYEEYDQLKEVMLNHHLKELHELAKQYALSNVRSRIGDIITNNAVTIKADKFSVSTMFASHPYIIWHGDEYTKAGKRRKDLSRGSVRDSSIVEAK